MHSSSGHGLGPTRARVLRVLLASVGPVDVTGVADSLGMHPNTARFHLDALVRAEYATRLTESEGAQGRPRVRYAPTSTAPDVTSDHLRELLTVFVDHFASVIPNVTSEAESAGRAWGRATTPDPDGDPIDSLVTHTTNLGFATTRAGDELRFRRCPYRVNDDPETSPICAAHLGMMRGFLENSGADATAESLRRVDNMCVARIVPTELGDAKSQ